MNINIEDLKIVILKSDLKALEKALINYDINSVDKYGNNILHFCIKNHRSINFEPNILCKKFTSLGINSNAKQKNSDQRSGLYIAVLLKTKEWFLALVESGVNIDSVDSNGNSPLWQSVMNYTDGNDFFVEELLKLGADPGLKNKHGISPKELAYGLDNTNRRKFFSC